MTSSSLFNLRGLNAVVTGVSEGGLGHWTAVALAQHGANVMVSDVPGTEPALAKTVSDIRAHGVQGELQTADLTSPEQISELAEKAAEQFGKIDILVNHAGVMLRKPSFETSLDEWERVMKINLTATFLLDKAFAEPMVRQGSGAIINTSTVYTNIVGPLPEAAYYASKAGVANLTRGFASEWGMSGVTVNCVAPGVFYPTPMTLPLGADPARLKQMTDRTMLGRLGNAETDLAGTVVWLASPAARYVTGQIIFVDGGWSAK